MTQLRISLLLGTQECLIHVKADVDALLGLTCQLFLAELIVVGSLSVDTVEYSARLRHSLPTGVPVFLSRRQLCLNKRLTVDEKVDDIWLQDRVDELSLVDSFDRRDLDLIRPTIRTPNLLLVVVDDNRLHNRVPGAEAEREVSLNE